MGKVFVGAVIVMAIALGGCGDDGDKDSSSDSSTAQEQASAERVQSRDCITPSAAAVQALEDSLSGGGALRAARALPSADSFKGPAELHDDAVFIAAKLGATTSLIWLTTREFVDSGKGVAVAASAGTRRVSSLGADEDPALIGISPQSRGLAEVRACVTERVQAAERKARQARVRRQAQRVRARRVAARRARRAAQRAARAADRAAEAVPEPDATLDAPSMQGPSSSNWCGKRDGDGDGIYCEGE